MQCDSQWGSETMGPNGYTMCNYGCFVTDVSAIINYYGILING